MALRTATETRLCARQLDIGDSGDRPELPRREQGSPPDVGGSAQPVQGLGPVAAGRRQTPADQEGLRGGAGHLGEFVVECGEGFFQPVPPAREPLQLQEIGA